MKGENSSKTDKGYINMRLIIGIIGIVWVVILGFLWMIVRSASNSIDDDTQAMLDDEQTQYIKDYFEKKNIKVGKDNRNEKS